MKFCIKPGTEQFPRSPTLPLSRNTKEVVLSSQIKISQLSENCSQEISLDLCRASSPELHALSCFVPGALHYPGYFSSPKAGCRISEQQEKRGHCAALRGCCRGNPSEEGSTNQGCLQWGPSARPPPCGSSALPPSCTDCTALTPDCHPKFLRPLKIKAIYYSISQYKHHCFKCCEEGALKQTGNSCSLCIKRAHPRDFSISLPPHILLTALWTFV